VGSGRLGVGRESGDRLEVQAVLLEVAERVVADDDGVDLAPGEAARVGLVELGEVRTQVIELRGVVRGVLGVERGQAALTSSASATIRVGSSQK
jgi:hypothetical protein